jgi:hypothetical protein
MSCTKIEAFNVCATALKPSDRQHLCEQFLKGVGDQWTSMVSGGTNGNRFIRLNTAIAWIFEDILSNAQLSAKTIRESKKITTLKNPMFEEGIHWCTYTPSVEHVPVIYLTVEGLAYWSMAYTTPKANLVKAMLARKSVAQPAQKDVRVKKRRRLCIESTPPKKKKLRRHSMPAPNTLSNKVSNKVLGDTIKLLNRTKHANSQVYFIHDGEYVKIGVTNSGVQKRIKNLQTGSSRPLRVVATIQSCEPYKLESSLHTMFADKRVKGEWFDITIEKVASIVRFVESM